MAWDRSLGRLYGRGPLKGTFKYKNRSLAVHISALDVDIARLERNIVESGMADL